MYLSMQLPIGKENSNQCLILALEECMPARLTNQCYPSEICIRHRHAFSSSTLSAVPKLSLCASRQSQGLLEHLQFHIIVSTKIAFASSQAFGGPHSSTHDWCVAISEAHRTPCTVLWATCSAPQRATAPLPASPPTLCIVACSSGGSAAV